MLRLKWPLFYAREASDWLVERDGSPFRRGAIHFLTDGFGKQLLSSGWLYPVGQYDCTRVVRAIPVVLLNLGEQISI